MRRISLALALLGAVAAAGCGGGTNESASGSGRGVPGSTFTVTVRLPAGGTVRSGNVNTSGSFVADNRIVCGTAGSTCAADYAWDPSLALSVVALQATADAGKIIEGWAGDCQGGDSLCVLSGKADKYVLVRFNAPDQVTGHPNWSPALATSTLHVTAARTFSLMCNRCHGVDWTGQAIAPSCYQCHNLDALTVADPVTATTQGPHFDRAGFGGHSSGTCARCHTSGGFLDYLGADGTRSNVLTITYPSGAGGLDGSSFAAGPFTCKTCHNSVSDPFQGILGQKKFPSGKVVTTDAVSALCSQCHDGGRPGYEVAQLSYVLDPAVSGTTSLDGQIVAAQNKVVRAHYLPAASTVFGEEAANWYQFAGNSYTARNEHGGKASCTSCHDPHTGQLPADGEIAAKCGVCHFNEAGAAVSTLLELEENRQFGFEGDIDGDGVQESLNLEIQGLGAKLYAAMQAYATTVAGAGICYVDNRYYVQANTTDACGAGANNVAYNRFTRRLLRAGYNYLMFQNDPGGWAHNPRYEVEVIYDTIADLNLGLGANFVANGNRAFDGHFGAAEDPSPYAAMIYHGGSNALTGEVLPAMGFTSGACYQCHGGAGGFAAYLAAAPASLTGAVVTDANKVTALQCSTCHTWGANMQGVRSDVATLYFPPQKGNPAAAAQKVVSFASTALPNSFAVCGTCHSGRENGASVDLADPTGLATFTLGFKNPHYLGAAGLMLGSRAGVLYQYAGHTYAADPVFWATTRNGNAPGPHGSPHGAQCTGCHQPKASKHTFEVDFTYCGGCHTGAYALTGTGSPEEEYQAATAELLTAIRAYVTTNLAAIQIAVNGSTFGTGSSKVTVVGSTVTNVCYNGGANPYFFLEIAGVCQDGVANAPTVAMSFGKFNGQLLKAAYNYQWTQKEPGAWAHNEYYVMEAIYDSIVDLGGTPSFTVSASTTNTALNRP